jgi:2-polyprenyl-3-methyl-5-hydroxy-6-metoxy-1,4-benzoquinol methylase
MSITTLGAPLRLEPLDWRIPDWSRTALAGRSCPFCGTTNHAPLIRPDGIPVAYCQDCALWYATRLPGAEALAAFYAEYWHTHRRERLNRQTARELGRGLRRNSPAELALLRLEAMLGSLENRRVLEVGCGLGGFLLAAREKGAEVVGAEASGEVAEFARRYLRLAVYTGGLEDCLAHAGPFDAVVMLDLIEHIAEPAEFLTRVFSGLKPGGLALLWTPNGGAAGDGDPETARSWVGFRVDLEHLQYLSARAVQTLARKHDLEVEYLETLGSPDLAGIASLRSRDGFAGRLKGSLSRALAGRRRLKALLEGARRAWSGSDPDPRRGTYHLFAVLRKPGGEGAAA